MTTVPDPTDIAEQPDSIALGRLAAITEALFMKADSWEAADVLLDLWYQLQDDLGVHPPDWVLIANNAFALRAGAER